MYYLRYLGIILVMLSPLLTTSSNAQSFGAPIDILGPVQEDLIRDVQQNPTANRSKTSTTIRYSNVHPKFISALRVCDNDYIQRFIHARRVVEDTLFIHPQLLQRARQCGAISSARLEQLLNYQRAYKQQNLIQTPVAPTSPRKSPAAYKETDKCIATVQKLKELERQGVKEATVKLPEGDTITDSPRDLIMSVMATCNN